VATHDTAVALLDTEPVDDTCASRSPQTKVLTLEIDADTDPIAGRLSERGAPGQQFFGWLGLARALEHVLEPNKPTPSP
jgi:hypothetical protein